MIRSFILAFAMACSSPSQPDDLPEPEALNPAAVEGVENRALKVLLHDHWESVLRRSPVWATMLGDHRYDEQLPAIGKDVDEAANAENAAFLERAKVLQKTTLSPQDQVTVSLFIEKMSNLSLIHI